MEREPNEIEDLKRKLNEVVKITHEFRKEFGVNVLYSIVPERWNEDFTVFKAKESDSIKWMYMSREDNMVHSGEIPIEYLEKDIKEIKLMLLKEIQDSYRKSDEQIKDDIERLKVRIKELTASRKSKIGKWFKVKQLIEELG
jgi:hypothetical protein